MAYIDDVYSVVQIQPTGIEAFVRLSQNENGRRLYFAITGGEIPAGSTATLSGTKPDGVVYSKTGTITGNVVTILEDIQLTAAAGPWPAKLRILNGGNVVATGRIRFVIDKDPVAAGAVPSDSQLEGLVAEAAAYAEAAKDGAYYGSPLTASTVAGMTDTNRVYVYTGSESGYTAGNWYFWNGSAWTSGGVYNSQGLNTDTSLSVAGMAADAKATGEEIADLKADLNQDTDAIRKTDTTLIPSKKSVSLTGNWSVLSSGQTSFIAPIKSGDIIELYANANLDFYGILASMDGYAESSAADFASGYTGLSRLTANSSVVFIAPSDAKYLFVSGNMDIDRTPIVWTINGYDMLLDVNGNFKKLKSNLVEVTTWNLLNNIPYKQGRTAGGITFEWNGDRCEVSGTSTSNTFVNIYANTSAMPEWLSTGKTYYFGIEGTTYTSFDVYGYDSSGTQTVLYKHSSMGNNVRVTIPDTIVGVIIRLFIDNGRTVNETVYPYIVTVPSNLMLEDKLGYIIQPSKNGEDKAAEINAALVKYGRVKLEAGDFIVSSTYIQIPIGCTLEGCGAKTRLVCSNQDLTTAVNMSAHSAIRNLEVYGGLNSRPASTAEGSRNGISANGVIDVFWIEDCIVTGFSRSGIFILNSGGGTIPCCVNNTLVRYCFTGIDIQLSEYEMITNVTCRECYRGCREHGGNNRYVGCGFDSNNVGLQITSDYVNNSHGSFSGCSFNHNDDYGMYLGAVTNGELFTGCQIHFATINMSGLTRGVQFNGCQFGQNTVFNNNSTGVNFLTDCTFWSAPTFNGTGQWHINNCYNFRTNDPIQ